MIQELQSSKIDWVETATTSISLVSMAALTVERIIELAETRPGQLSNPISRFSKPLLILSSPIIIKHQLEALYRLVNHVSPHPDEDQQLVCGGLLMLANMVFPQYRLPLFAAQVALDSYGVYHSWQSGKSKIEIGEQLFFAVLFNTGRRERSDIATQWGKLTNNRLVRSEFIPHTQTAFFSPDIVHDYGYQGFDAYTGFSLQVVPGRVYSINELSKAIPRCAQYIHGSKTLKGLVDYAHDKEIRFRIVEGGRMSYCPETRSVLIGSGTASIGYPPNFLIELAHELTHASDELAHATTSLVEDRVHMAGDVEAYALENQLRVAAEFYHNNLHPGYSISLGQRTFDSRSFFHDFSNSRWQETRSYIRDHILTAHLFEAVQGVSSTYAETYRRMFSEEGGHTIFHGYATNTLHSDAVDALPAFGAFIRSLREAAGLNMHAAAAKAGLNYSSWSRMEIGGRIPRRSNIPQIAMALGVPAETILAFRPEVKRPILKRKTDNLTPLGRVLSTLRERAGLTIIETAQRVGKTEATYGSLEIRERAVFPSTLREIADYFGVSYRSLAYHVPDQFLGDAATIDTLPAGVGRNLRRYRIREKGLTLAEAAIDYGLSSRATEEIELGHVAPYPRTLARIATALAVDLDEIGVISTKLAYSVSHGWIHAQDEYRHSDILTHSLKLSDIFKTYKQKHLLKYRIQFLTGLYTELTGRAPEQNQSALYLWIPKEAQNPTPTCPPQIRVGLEPPPTSTVYDIVVAVYTGNEKQPWSHRTKSDNPLLKMMNAVDWLSRDFHDDHLNERLALKEKWKYIVDAEVRKVKSKWNLSTEQEEDLRQEGLLSYENAVLNFDFSRAGDSQEPLFYSYVAKCVSCDLTAYCHSQLFGGRGLSNALSAIKKAERELKEEGGAVGDDAIAKRAKMSEGKVKSVRETARKPVDISKLDPKGEMTPEEIFDRIQFDATALSTDRLAESEARQEFWRIIERTLPEAQVRQLRAYYDDGLSCAQIAEIEALSISGVSKSIRQARDRLVRLSVLLELID